MMPAQPSTAFLELLADAITASVPAVKTLTATSTTASPDLTAVSSMTGLQIGAVVITPVAAVGKTVVAMDNAANTATLSGNAGVTATGSWTFSPPANPLPLSVGLFTGAPTLTIDTVYADLTQPTYAGYATQSATIGALRGDAAGDIIIPLGTSTWQPTGAVSPEQTITGFFVFQPGTDTLLFSEILAAPWVAAGPLSALDVNDDIYIPADSVYGGICSTCSP
jgi:hypothetical protein